MNSQNYKLFEEYMLSCNSDSAHDKDHIYRVLYVALDIADHEKHVDHDVLICACLLHDIGRKEQFDDQTLCHAAVGSEKACEFLISEGFQIDYAEDVRDCIKVHRFRTGEQPRSLEAKILFDADKIDATGTLGIARTIFQEYKYKLEGLYGNFYTKRGAEIAQERQASAQSFYKAC